MPGVKRSRDETTAPTCAKHFREWVRTLEVRMNPPAMDDIFVVEWKELRDAAEKCHAAGDDWSAILDSYNDRDLWPYFPEFDISEYVQDKIFASGGVKSDQEIYAAAVRATIDGQTLQAVRWLSKLKQKPLSTPVPLNDSIVARCVSKLGRLDHSSAMDRCSTGELIGALFGGDVVKDNEQFEDELREWTGVFAGFLSVERLSDEDCKSLLDRIQTLANETNAYPLGGFEYPHLWRKSHKNLINKLRGMHEKLQSEHGLSPRVPFVDPSAGSSSTTSAPTGKAPPKCKCGLPAASRTSHTLTNPGRKFFGCRKFPSKSKCSFFEWDDGDEPTAAAAAAATTGGGGGSQPRAADRVR